MDPASISITVITGVFSGIGGIVLQKYWSAKSPSIRLTSVSFQGSLIQIPQKLSELTKVSEWGAPLEGFVNFDSLMDYERENGIYAERIGQAKTLSEQWLKAYRDDFEKEILPKSVLEACPYFHTPIIASSLYGDLRRRKPIQLPVVGIEDLGKKTVFEIESENEKGIVLHLGSKAVKFPVGDNFGEEQKAVNKLVAYSFLMGNSKNVRRIIEDFVNSAARAILEVESVRTAVQELLTRHAVLKFGMTITNTGTAPQLIKPHGAVAVAYGNSRKLFVVENKLDGPKHGEAETLLAEHSTNVPNFLDRHDQSPYILVPGNSSLEATFISIEEEGFAADEIIKFYRLGGVSASAMLETSSGKALLSPAASFSKSLSEDRRKVLRAAANKAIKTTC